MGQHSVVIGRFKSAPKILRDTYKKILRRPALLLALLLVVAAIFSLTLPKHIVGSPHRTTAVHQTVTLPSTPVPTTSAQTQTSTINSGSGSASDSSTDISTTTTSNSSSSGSGNVNNSHTTVTINGKTITPPANGCATYGSTTTCSQSSTNSNDGSTSTVVNNSTSTNSDVINQEMP